MTYERTLEELVDRIVAREFKLNNTPTSPFHRAVQICGLAQARINGDDIPHYSKGKFRGAKAPHPRDESR